MIDHVTVHMIGNAILQPFSHEPPFTSMFLPAKPIRDATCSTASRFPASSAVAQDPTLRPLYYSDLAVQESNWSRSAGFHVRLCDLPNCVRLFTVEPSLDAYHFQYRARVEKGETRLTIPALGVAARSNRRDDVLLIPPRVRVQAEWRNAKGRIATFFFAPRLLQELCGQTGLHFLERPSLASFSLDQPLDALCRLLIEETEAHSPRGPLYFEALARALALSLLCRLRDPKGPVTPRNPAAPAGIECVVQRLENEFREHLSVAELAHQARLSVDHFVRTFQKVTGSTPHQYVLRVRLNHARKLMAQRAPVMSLAEIAVTCGFADQAHFGRHFRRFFGTTPAAFLQAQVGTRALAKACHRENVPSGAKTFYTPAEAAV